ncbi:alcohol dehydrogenase 2-like [Bradysia coprophila]|uniref:alcohol dehydrogenase 2-like n=1 Tax=Bradysia coprophila TaxID=38358 RepID=UPI00187DA798|nr:alcohol dehydrogenase 2-like [Bradysia coprophila]
MTSFEGKTLVVTGGCSGIGYATVENFLKRNIQNVAILDIDDPRNVIETLRNTFNNPNVIFIKTDVTKKDQVKSAFAEVISKFNYVDFLVANAGVLREDDYELTINVNVLGLTHTIYTGIDVMNKDKGRGGIIISTASVAGLDGFYSMPVYSATKHAVIGLNRCLGTDHFYNKFGIKFLTVCPSFTDTPLLLEDLGDRLTEGTLEATLHIKTVLPSQTPDVVGRSITETIINGANGSFWIVSNGETKEVTLKSYFIGQ